MISNVVQMCANKAAAVVAVLVTSIPAYADTPQIFVSDPMPQWLGAWIDATEMQDATVRSIPMASLFERLVDPNEDGFALMSLGDLRRVQHVSHSASLLIAVPTENSLCASFAMGSDLSIERLAELGIHSLSQGAPPKVTIAVDAGLETLVKTAVSIYRWGSEASFEPLANQDPETALGAGEVDVVVIGHIATRGHVHGVLPTLESVTPLSFGEHALDLAASNGLQVGTLINGNGTELKTLCEPILAVQSVTQPFPQFGVMPLDLNETSAADLSSSVPDDMNPTDGNDVNAAILSALGSLLSLF